MKKICFKCKNEIDEGDKFCRFCGTPANSTYDDETSFSQINVNEIITDKKGNVYEGIFEDGDLVSGIIRFKDGYVYEGTFVNGLLHGPGKITNNKGDTFEGNFENGIMTGKIKATMKNGLVAEVNADTPINKFLYRSAFRTGQTISKIKRGTRNSN